MLIAHWPLVAVLLIVVNTLGPVWLGPALSLLPLAAGRWKAAALLLCLSGWTLLRSRSPLDPLADNLGQPVEVVATVSEPAVPSPRGSRFVVEVHHWVDRLDGFPGRWLVEAPRPAGEVALGDLWHLRGRLVGLAGPAFPGDWDARGYWRRRGVTQRLRCPEAHFLRPARPEGLAAATLAWRYRLSQRLADRLDAGQAGILAAVVFGDGSRLSGEQIRLFRQAGVSHLLVASGTNVALLVAWLYWLGGRAGWSPVRCSGAGLLLVPLYVALAGASPSMLRAGAMGWLALLARWTGYSLDLSRSLALGSLGVLLWDPRFVHDLGFQLSFGAVASLAWLAPMLSPWLPARLPGRTALQASLACSLGLAPIALYSFHILQPLAPLANLWMGPLVEGLLPAGLLWSLLDLGSPALGEWLGQALAPWLWFVDLSVRFWADCSPQCQVPNPGLAGWLAWLALVGLLRLGPGLASVAASGLIVLTALLLTPVPESGLRVRLLWLGRGPALWIREGDSHCLLLSQAEQRRQSLNLQLSQGVRRFEPVAVLDEATVTQGWGEGRLEQAPGQLLYHRGALCIGLTRPGWRDGLSWGVDSSAGWSWGGEPDRRLQKGEAWQLQAAPGGLWSLTPWR